MVKFKIDKKLISQNSKTYFIADIAANHDGSLVRAKKLIKLCAQAGADAAKFQHFKAETIVSDFGFRNLGKKSHQSKWSESVFRTYKKASINLDWTKKLKKECDKYKIDFMTAPYDLSYVDKVHKFVKAFKIGSGDLTWDEIILKISKKKKPVILATGASDFYEVKKAVNLILKHNKCLVLMQCNTNYTNKEENFNYINLNVLRTYKRHFKNKIILGLSDHTSGYSTVLGAVALGARVIEKHFTDNNNRIGPDHQFSMNPNNWKEMVQETRRLESALGDGIKRVEKNEQDTVFLQRRGVYAKKIIKKNTIFNIENTIPLRPHYKNIFSIKDIKKILGKKSNKNIKIGEWIKITNIR
jgi:sialic acid synthase SpsE